MGLEIIPCSEAETNSLEVLVPNTVLGGAVSQAFAGVLGRLP